MIKPLYGGGTLWKYCCVVCGDLFVAWRHRLRFQSLKTCRVGIHAINEIDLVLDGAILSWAVDAEVDSQLLLSNGRLQTCVSTRVTSSTFVISSTNQVHLPRNPG